MTDDTNDMNYEAGAMTAEPWARTHARENPGHTTKMALNQPDMCETCKAKSPAWEMVDVVPAHLSATLPSLIPFFNEYGVFRKAAANTEIIRHR